MAVTSYTDATLNLILREFAIDDGQYDFKPLTSGLINDTFLVSTAGKPSYVLQRINHVVFENVSGLMANFELAVASLKSDTYAQINVIQTRKGQTYFSFQKPIGYWRLITYLADTRTFDNAPDANIAFEAGRIIGNFHQLLEDTEVAKFVDTIPKFHDIKFRAAQFQTALKTAGSERLTNAKNAISFAQKTLHQLSKLQLAELPVRICHNDTKLNNILFSEKTKKALCLIDLDTLMAGHFLYDFGDAIRTISNTGAEDEKNHALITFDLPLFKAFVMGLSSIPPFLNKKEVDQLSQGIVLMPFLHGIRALNDYLENDKYYKVNYENQNLDRAKSLFYFTQKALEQQENAQRILHELLPFK